MRIRTEDSCLLIIDIQERLFPAIAEHAELAAHTLWLQQVAQRIGVPVLLTEQYSKGLGQTIAALRTGHGPEAIVEKLHFSAVSEGELLQRSGGERYPCYITDLDLSAVLAGQQAQTVHYLRYKSELEDALNAALQQA